MDFLWWWWKEGNSTTCQSSHTTVMWHLCHTVTMVLFWPQMYSTQYSVELRKERQLLQRLHDASLWSSFHTFAVTLTEIHAIIILKKCSSLVVRWEWEQSTDLLFVCIPNQHFAFMLVWQQKNSTHMSRAYHWLNSMSPLWSLLMSTAV